MPRKGQTIVDKDIMIVLKENKGFALSFSDIFKDLIKRDLFHYQQQISKNLKTLIEKGKVVKVEDKVHPHYGIPATRANGSKYIIVKGFGLKDETVELGK